MNNLENPANNTGKLEGNLEGKQESKPLSVEDIKKSRADLQARVEAAKKQKDEDIAKQLKDREAVIAEDARLTPLFEEAQNTLEYFETQNEQGLLTDPKDIAELDNMRKLVASLGEQRGEATKKYDAIMANPEVYNKVWEEANGEKMSREIKEKRDGSAKEIQEKIDTLAQAIERLSQDRESAWGAQEARNRELGETITELRDIVKKACENLDSGHNKTIEVLGDLRTPQTYAEYIAGAEQYRKNLGLFKGKEKAAVDYVTSKKSRFDEADKKAKALDEARQYMKQLDAQVDVLGEQYKSMFADAWRVENEIRKEFPAAEGYVAEKLPHKVEYSLREKLQRDAGLGKMEGGKWVRPYDLDIDEKGRKRQEAEKYHRWDNVVRSMKKIAGEFAYMTNPETGRLE